MSSSFTNPYILYGRNFWSNLNSLTDGSRLGVTSSILACQQVHFQRFLGPNSKEISHHLLSRTHHCSGGYRNSQNHRSLNSWQIGDQPEFGQRSTKPPTNHRPQTTDHGPPTTDHILIKTPTTDHSQK